MNIVKQFLAFLYCEDMVLTHEFLYKVYFWHHYPQFESTCKSVWQFFIVAFWDLRRVAIKTLCVQTYNLSKKKWKKKITNIFRPNLALIWPWRKTLKKICFFSHPIRNTHLILWIFINLTEIHWNAYYSKANRLGLCSSLFLFQVEGSPVGISAMAGSLTGFRSILLQSAGNAAGALSPIEYM